MVVGDVLTSKWLTSKRSKLSFRIIRFNRINIEVLSVVAQQIHSILTALSLKQKRFIFQGKEIPLSPQVGIFITMNPGYAGRTELPDNLTSMFRPVSMVTPDSIYIAENFLFSEGFQNTRVKRRNGKKKKKKESRIFSLEFSSQSVHTLPIVQSTTFQTRSLWFRFAISYSE